MKKQDSNTPAKSKTEKILDRFLSKLMPSPTGCMEYTGGKLKTGYGIFHDSEGSGSVLAHRFAYQSYHEVTLKSDEYVRHLCNNPSCSHPEHLAVGSAKDNSADMVAAKRSTKGRKRSVKRFTDEEKKRIHELHAAGVSQYAIARRFGRSEPTISVVLHPRAKKLRKPNSSSGAAIVAPEKIKTLWERLDAQLVEDAELRRAA